MAEAQEMLNEIPFMVGALGAVCSLVYYIVWRDRLHDIERAGWNAERKQYTEYVEDEPKRAVKHVARYLSERDKQGDRP